MPKVAIDGIRLPDIVLLAQAAGRPRTATELHRSIAEAVFQRLLYLEGIRSGIRVSHAHALQLARAELAAYLKDPATHSAAPLPEGETPRQYFLSPDAVTAYRIGLVTGKERDAILSRRSGKTADVLTGWFRGVLSRHTITIDGQPPAFSLPEALHAALLGG